MAARLSRAEIACFLMGLGLVNNRQSMLKSKDESLAFLSPLQVGVKALYPSITASFSPQHIALAWRLMRPIETKNLSTFNAEKIKRAAAEDKGRKRKKSK